MLNALTFLFLTLPCASAPLALDAHRISELLGQEVTLSSGELRVSLPQDELAVAVDSFPVVPSMGMTSWLTFSPDGRRARLTGEIVALEYEVRPVEEAVLKSGLKVTAVHNHFLRDVPKVMFVHVSGQAAPETLAASARLLLDAVGRLRALRPAAAAQPAAVSSLDTKGLEAILGRPGQTSGGVFKVMAARSHTWMAFQGGPKKAAAAGEFALRQGEVEGVTAALLSHGMEVSALHDHCLHFWGVGPAAELARGLRAALDRLTPSKRR